MTQQSRNKLGLIAALCGLVILCFTTVMAAKRGVSDVFSYLVQEHLNSWSKSNATPTKPVWDKVQGFYQTAIQETPGNPQLLQYGGILHEWHIDMDSNDQKTQQQRLSQSINNYRASTTHRPTWPYAWMNLAIALDQAGQNNTEFQHAFTTALTLGSWERTILFNMTELGLRAWKNLTPENRILLIKNIKNAAKRNTKRVIAIATEYNSLLILCHEIKDNKQIAKHCKSRSNLKPLS